MKRTVTGFVLLAVLLLGGLFVQNRMERLHIPIAEMLEAAALDARQGNWISADSKSRDAHQRWETAWNFSAAFADHDPMEEIDSLFARLEVFAREEDTAEYTAACGELSRKIRAMADAHALSLPNLL